MAHDSGAYPGVGMGRIRDLLHRVTASPEELRDEDLLALRDRLGVRPIRQSEPRRWVTVVGEVRSVTTRRAGSAPTFEATVTDGSDDLTTVFLGRHDVPGIVAGRRLILSGVVAPRDGTLTMVNPEYRLLP